MSIPANRSNRLSKIVPNVALDIFTETKFNTAVIIHQIASKTKPLGNIIIFYTPNP